MTGQEDHYKPALDLSGQKTKEDQTVADDWAAALPHFSRARQAIAPKAPKSRKWRWALAIVVLIVALASSMAFVLTRGFSLPHWAITQIEDRVNRTIAGNHLPEGTAISLGAIDFLLSKNLEPSFMLRDVQLEQKGAEALIALPQSQITLSGAALLRGAIRPKSVVLSGAHLAVTRDPEGHIRFDLGGLSGQGAVQSLDEAFDSIDKMFASPIFEEMSILEGQALGLSLKDERAGREWLLGDGRLIVENKSEGVALELGITLLDGTHPAQASLGAITSKKDRAARLWANFDQIAARDLAEQAAPFAILSMVEAPISGNVSAALDADGVLGEFQGNLTLGAGQVEAVGGGGTIGFEQGAVALRYDIAQQRVMMDRLSVQSPSLRVEAQGWGDLLTKEGLPSPPGEMPQTIVSQLKFTQVMVDPQGLFAEPVSFSSGLADTRITLEPFHIDIGELTLNDGDDYLRLWGQMGQAQPQGWQGSIDVAINRMGSERLLKLWPLIAVPKTRKWLAENVAQGELAGVNAALRFYPDREPRFALDYDYSGGEVRFLRTLPPITQASGHASILGNVYTMVVDKGYVTAPQGGDISVDGSMFQVLDITQKPAQAEITLLTKSPLEAALSLLDEEPFAFLTKAKLPVDLAQGRAELTTVLRLPLVAKVKINEVSYSVTGKLFDVSSDKLVKGRRLAADSLAVEVSPRWLRLSGKASLDGVDFEGKFEQSLIKGDKGKAKVVGQARLDDANLRKFGIALPKGWLSGRTTADVTIDLQSGTIPKLEVSSTLKGLGLSALGWSKPSESTGKLSLNASLSAAPEVHSLSLEAGDLTMAARVKTKQGQGLDRMDIDRLTIGKWLDVALELRGQGKGVMPLISLSGGKLDLNGLPKGGGNGAAAIGGMAPIQVKLDRLQVTKSIALTGLSGEVTPRGSGFAGSFISSLNGVGRLSGAMEPRGGGTAVQIWSQDAGRIMAAAGIFNKGQGGQLNVTIQPDGPGRFLGNATFKDFSVQNAPVLAGMLSAASVVGLLDQLQGQGIYFDEGDLAFRVKPQGIEIVQGSAHGASMGISFAGLYRQSDNFIDIQGTISPIYLLNGLGQIFASKGEGLFGFNYRLSGAANHPSVMVNPLSILTPGRFREIFRRDVPVLEGAR